MSCRGFCCISPCRFKSISVNKRTGKGPYSVQGVMFCVKCEYFFQTEGKFNRCPCCHAQLRSRSRGRHVKNWRMRRKEEAITMAMQVMML